MIRSLLFASFAFALPALAQDFELDLSEPGVPLEFRPTLAVIGAVPADGEEVTKDRAKLLEAELVKQATSGDQFRTVTEPDLASKSLAEGWAEARACAAWACFEKVAKALKVNRVILATVVKEGSGSEVTLHAYDPGFSELLTVTQDSGEKAERSFAGLGPGKSRAQKDREFAKKMAGFLRQGLTKLATANGKIVVDNPEVTALVTVDGVEVGTGSVEAPVQRGSRVVRVTAAGYEPYEETVSVEPARAVTVKVTLRAKALERPLLTQTKDVVETQPLYNRPGLYVALAGVAAAGVGLAFGAMAQGTASKAAQPDADGVVPVTRAQARAAQTNALLANVLVGSGAALVAGGGVWMFLVPTTSRTTAVETAPPAEGGGFGVMIGAGGTF